MLGAVAEKGVVALHTWNRENSVSAGMRGAYLEDEMAQLRTLRRSTGIKRLGGREHSRYGNSLCKGLEVRDGGMCKE